MLDLSRYIPTGLSQSDWRDETCQAVLDPKVRDAFRDATGKTLNEISVVTGERHST